jgi:signal transduction histidine kinase
MTRDGNKNKKLYIETLINLPRQSEEEKGWENEWTDTERLLWNALEELSLQLSNRTSELQTAKVHLQQERGKRKGLQLTLRSLASELVLTEERERRSLATDLHDSVAQSLALCKYYLEELESVPISRSHQRKLGDTVAIIDQALEQTRSLIFELSPPILHDLGLEAALRSLTTRMQHLHGIKIAYTYEGKGKKLPEDLSVLLFRAVRELLFNIVKHAKATQVTISLAKNHDQLQIEVVDDGIGFDPAQAARRLRRGGSGFGLFSVSERLQHLGGSFDITSRPGSGTRALLTAPLGSKRISSS